MAWLKLEDTFCDHPKFVKLSKRLGVRQAEARGLVSTLWAWTLRQATDGCLESFDIEDIEISSGWEGETGKFVDACVSVKLIDKDENGYSIHGWMERAGSFKEARRVAKYREEQRKKKIKEQNSTELSYDSNVTKQNSHVTVQNCHKAEERRGEERRKNPYEKNKEKIKEVINHYMSVHKDIKQPSSTAKNGAISKVNARLNDGFTVEQISHAIDGNARDKWYRDRGKHDLAFICQSEARVQEFIDKDKSKRNNKGPPGPDATEEERVRRDENGNITGRWIGDQFFRVYN